jgi:hypothetical protein
MRKPTAIAVLWVLGAGLAGGPALAEPIPATLAKALEGAELDTADAWAYRKSMRVDAMDEPAVISVVRWDPSKPAGEQCTVLSLEVVGPAEGKADEQDACDDAGERELYGDLKEVVNDSVIETVSEDERLAVYRITPRDKEKGFRMGGVQVDVGDEELKDLVGTLRVVKSGPGAPYVERLAFNLKRPAGNLVAKLGQLDILFTYAPEATTGTKLMTGMSVDLQMSLFTMFNVTTHVKSSYDEYVRVK